MITGLAVGAVRVTPSNPRQHLSMLSAQGSAPASTPRPPGSRFRTSPSPSRLGRDVTSCKRPANLRGEAGRETHRDHQVDARAEEEHRTNRAAAGMSVAVCTRKSRVRNTTTAITSATTVTSAALRNARSGRR